MWLYFHPDKFKPIYGAGDNEEQRKRATQIFDEANVALEIFRDKPGARTAWDYHLKLKASERHDCNPSDEIPNWLKLWKQGNRDAIDTNLLRVPKPKGNISLLGRSAVVERDSRPKVKEEPKRRPPAQFDPASPDYIPPPKAFNAFAPKGELLLQQSSHRHQLHQRSRQLLQRWILSVRRRI